jgi:hypothetical protein
MSIPSVQSDSTLNKIILDFDGARKQLYHLFKNEYHAGGGKWVPVQGSRAPVNNIGAESMCLRIFPFLDINTVMNSLSAEGIILITKDIQDMIWNDLLDNAEEWNVDPKQRDSLVRLSTEICYLTLNRAYRNLERIYHQGTHMEESRDIQTFDRPKSIWSVFRRR